LQEQDIEWAESRRKVSFNIEEEDLEKAREAEKHEECLLRKPPQPSGETKERYFVSFKQKTMRYIYVIRNQ